MNEKLERLASEIGLAGNEALRFAFGLACVSRVRHLLEDERAVAGISSLNDFVEGRIDAEALREVAAQAAQVANQHQGSRSLDGAAHAAVSATFAVSKALAGQALEAASYAAYATVYAYGGYAVNDREAFQPEFDWQVAELRRLAS